MNRPIAAGFVFVAMALSGSAPAADRSGEARVDFSRLDRPLELKGLEGRTPAFAGLLLGRDGKGRPVVTWIALTQSEGKAHDLLHIDLDGDRRFSPEERFKPTRVREGGIATFDLGEIRVAGRTHTGFLLDTTGSPLRDMFSLRLFLDGKEDQERICGFHPALRKAALMASTPGKAPLLDLGCGAAGILYDSRRLPLDGEGTLTFYLAIPGSTPEAVTVLGMHNVPEEGFHIEIDYPARRGRAAFKADVNDRCNAWMYQLHLRGREDLKDLAEGECRILATVAMGGRVLTASFKETVGG